MDSLTISFQQWQCRNNTTICNKNQGVYQVPSSIEFSFVMIKISMNQLLPDTAHVNRCKVRDLANF